MQYEALSSLIADNFLLDQVGSNHKAGVTQFIFGRALEQHFAQAMRKQKYVIARKVIPKFFNWPMLLKDIWYAIKKTDIILLPILPLKEAKISETINILYGLVEHLGLENVIEDKIMLIKGNYFTVRNVTYILYQK